MHYGKEQVKARKRRKKVKSDLRKKVRSERIQSVELEDVFWNGTNLPIG